MKKHAALIQIVIIMLILPIMIGNNAFGDAAYQITPSEAEVIIKPDQKTVIEFELTGNVPSNAYVNAHLDDHICDFDWQEENRQSKNGVIMAIDLTGLSIGETSLIVNLENHEEVKATVTIKVISDPGTINFRGIAWDITPEEFDQALLNDGIEYEKKNNYLTTVDTWFRFTGIPFEAPYSYNLKIKPESFTYSSKTDNALTFVAGYSTRSIHAEFKPSYSVEKMTIGEPYRLARASYTIWNSDIPKKMTIHEAYQDLVDKLTKLYGEPNGSEDNSSSYRLKETWWHAKDGTGVALTLHHQAINYITIEYGTADESEYFNNIYTIQQKEKQQVKDSISDNLDGL